MRAQSDRFLLLSPALSPSPVPSLTQWPIHGPVHRGREKPAISHFQIRIIGGREGVHPTVSHTPPTVRMAKRSIEMTYRILVSVVKYNCDLRIHPRCVKKMHLFFCYSQVYVCFRTAFPLAGPPPANPFKVTGQPCVRPPSLVSSQPLFRSKFCTL